MLTMRSLFTIVLLTTLAGAQNIWQKVSTPSGAPQIRDFTINNSNNHWFLADRTSGFWISANQGGSWSQINNSGIPVQGWTIYYDTAHSQLLAGTTQSPAPCAAWWHSSNEGASWTQVSGILGCGGSPTTGNGPVVLGNGNILFSIRDNPGNLYCGTYVSADGGVTTSPATVNPSNCGNGFGLDYNSITNDAWIGTEAGGIYRSTDGGSNWNLVFPYIPSGPTGRGNGNAEAFNHDTSGNELVGTGGGIYKSSGSNGNYSWTKIINNPGVRSIFRDPNGYLYYGQADTNGQFTPCDTTAVYRSTDQAATWSPWTSGIALSSSNCNLEAWHFRFNPNDNKLYANIQDGATNNGWIYVTVNPVGSPSVGLLPPTLLTAAAH